MIASIPFPEWISPIVIPGLPFRWYGLMYLAAFACTYFLFLREIRRRKHSVDRDQVADFFFWAILGLLLGARLLYVVAFDSGQYARQPWLIVWPFRDGRFTGIQGMSYHGGLAGLITAVAIYARIRKIDLLEWGDTLAVSAPLGYTLGRLGNFMNGELVGRITAVRWGVVFPNARHHPASEDWVAGVAEQTGVPIYDPAQMVNLPRHPSQIYEALLEGLLLWLLLWCVFRRRRPFPGALIAIYILGYGTARFMAGYFRETNEAVGFVVSLGRSPADPAVVSGLFQLTEGQLISLAMIAAGFAALVVFRVIYRPPPAFETYED